MKFTIAIIALVLAVSVQSSVIPLTYRSEFSSLNDGTPVTVVGSPLTYSSLPLTYQSISTPITYAAHHTVTHFAVPTHTVHFAPTHVITPAVVPVATEGTYTAINNGAVHIAPLPGHLLSAESVNLEKAPGTF